MKRASLLVRTFLFAGSIVALALAFAPAAIAGDQDFTVVNRTGVEIHQLFVSPHDTDEWEEDILGKGTLEDGDELEVSFSSSEDAAMWDLMIVDDEGNSITWENLDLLEISEVTLHYKNGKSWADTE